LAVHRLGEARKDFGEEFARLCRRSLRTDAEQGTDMPDGQVYVIGRKIPSGRGRYDDTDAAEGESAREIAIPCLKG
jgi:hypothetical protein